MPIPTEFAGRLCIPAVAAPMFLVSGPQLVIESCKAGVVGSFPALNRRSSAGLEAWLAEIGEKLAAHEAEIGNRVAPFAVNLIVHNSNPRLQDDLALCVKYRVPLVITSLGAVREVVDAVHGYGGLLFHDVINSRHARKAAEAGVDGLIAVAAGAGGHAGRTSPFALVSEIRRFFHKTLLLAGCISTGRDIAAAELMGADLAYMGTRFITTRESLASRAYKRMIIGSSSADIVYTPDISGVFANFLRPSIEHAGLDPDHLAVKKGMDLGQELSLDTDREGSGRQPWKEIWSAGQGVGAVDNTPTAAELIDRLSREYHQAITEHQASYRRFFAAQKK